jgi:AAHS family 4-hydroxybenzoate transporter-like MFS transporter
MNRENPVSPVDVAGLIDDLPLKWFHVVLLIGCTLMALSDGYDIAVVGSAGPSLVREWKIANLALLAPVFSAGLFGVLIGAPIFGFVGDRFGRKNALFVSAIIYGVFSLATIAASSLEQMVVLRFLTGIGLGGVLPTSLALAAEYAPRKFKLTFGLVVSVGILIGAALPGPVAAWVVPTQGWWILFLIGGVMPIGFTIILYSFLPESMKFLSLRPERHSELVTLASRLRPDLAIDSATQFVAPEVDQRVGRSLKNLFAGDLAILTPLLWICFLISQMCNLFFLSWLPTLVADAGYPPTQAALSYTWFEFGGFIGATLISRPLEKIGFASVVIFFAGGIPAVASLGYVFGLGEMQSALVLMATGLCLTGLLVTMLAIAGAMYPTPIRSSGIGWTFALGRCGGVCGPIVGGFLVSLHLTTAQLFQAAVVPLVVGLIASIAFCWVYSARNKTLVIKEAVALH